MFEIAWSELLIVVVVAIVVVGPKELPGLLRAIGGVLGKLRRSADEFRRQFEDTMREAGAEDLQRELSQLRHNNPLNEIRNTIEEAARDATQPPALPPPTETPLAAQENGAAPAGDAPQGGEAGASGATAPAATDAGTPPAEAQPASSTDAAGNGSSHEPRINGEHRTVN